MTFYEAITSPDTAIILFCIVVAAVRLWFLVMNNREYG